MKPPPFLIGAALLFWGWQTGLLIPGAIMAVLLEAPRWVKSRWDFSEADFSRIWIFCTLLFFATAIYAFTSNEGPSQFRNLLQSPSLAAQRSAGVAAAHAKNTLFRWLPMVFFLFAAAQAYSANEGVPVETISLLLRWRWKRVRKAGGPATSGHTMNVAYFYFGLCLFAASVHTTETPGFFWGLCALLAAALWTRRSTRFSPAVWGTCLGAALALGYFGQLGLAQVQTYVGNLNLGLAVGGRGRHDPAKSQTDLGHIGRIKLSARIVIWLEPRIGAAPPLLREASYRRFNSRTWFADVNKDTDYMPVAEDHFQAGAYTLIPGKTNTLKVNIGCYLDHGIDLLPLPSGAGRLENLSATVLSRSPLGAVLEEGPGVVVFDALYGPGATIDSSYDEQQDLEVPPREASALDAAIAQMDLRTNTPAAAIAAISQFFSRNFSYSTYESRFPRSRHGETPLSRFLLRTHRGHCEYFATAGVLLLRRLHIPARYAVGYAVHEGSGGKFVVRERDAHAWCLYWDEARKSWRDLDFTPASWVQVEAAGHGWVQSFSDFWSRLRFELSKFRWGQTHLRQYILWGVVPILLVLLGQIIFQSWRRRRSAGPGGKLRARPWPGLDSEFYQVERALSEHGISRSSSEPLSAWLERMCRDTSLAQLREVFRELLRLHYRYRFDPRGLTAAEREALRNNVAACLRGIRALQYA